MSVDKLVDSAQLNSDLTSIANAIRTKGGTSASLAFPADFISAINAISGGGGNTDFVDLIARTPTTLSSNDVITIGKSAFRDYSTLTAVDFPNCTTLGDGAFNGCTSLASYNFHKVTTIQAGNAFNGVKGKLALPLLATYPTTNAINAFKGTEIDLGTSVSSIKSSMFNACSNFTVLVLRRTSLVSLANVNAFSSTKAASGGAGITIYIPKVLYDHLGDNGTSDYKKATNWITVNGYGTLTWEKIEGSYYETHYCDDTTI